MTWSILQSTVAQNTASTTSVGTTFSSNVSSGTKLVAFVTGNSGATVSSVKDGAGNSFTQQAHVLVSIELVFDCWTLDTPAGDVGTKPTITATFGSANTADIWVGEVSGLLAGSSGIIDGTVGTSSAGAGTYTTVGPPSYTDTAAGEALFYAYADNGVPVTFINPSGYTLDANNVNGNSNGNIGVAYKDSTGGTEAGAWSFSGGQQTFASGDAWGLILFSFKVASSRVLQSAVNGSGQATRNTATATFANNVKAGSVILAYAAIGNSTGCTVTSVKDGSGNNFTKVAAIGGTISFYTDVELWALAVPAGDVGTAVAVTVNISATTGLSVLIQEVTGISTTTDGTPGTHLGSVASGAVTATAATYSSTSAGEYLVSVYGDQGPNPSESLVAPAGWYLDPNSYFGGAVFAELAVAERPSTGGAESGSFTATAGQGTPYGSIVVAFQNPSTTVTTQAAQSARLIAQRIPQQFEFCSVPASPPALPAPSQSAKLLGIRLPQAIQSPQVQQPAPPVPAAQQSTSLLRLGIAQPSPQVLQPQTPVPAQPQSVSLVQQGLPVTLAAGPAVPAVPPAIAQPQQSLALFTSLPPPVIAVTEQASVPAPPPPGPAPQQAVSLVQQGLPATLQSPAPSVPVPPIAQPQHSLKLILQGLPATQQSPNINVFIPPAVTLTSGQSQQALNFIQQGLPATLQSPNINVFIPVVTTLTVGQPQVALNLLLQGLPVTLPGPATPSAPPPVPVTQQSLQFIQAGRATNLPGPAIPAPPAPVPASQTALNLLLLGLPVSPQSPQVPQPAPPGIQPQQSLTFIQQGLATEPAPNQVPVPPVPIAQPQHSTTLLQSGLPTPGNFFQAPPFVPPPPPAGGLPQSAGLLFFGLTQEQAFAAALTPPPPEPAPQQSPLLIQRGMATPGNFAQAPAVIPPPPPLTVGQPQVALSMLRLGLIQESQFSIAIPVFVPGPVVHLGQPFSGWNLNLPQQQWHTGASGGQWTAGTAASRWHTGPPGSQWNLNLPFTR